MPSCPVPTKECQSLSGTASSDQTAYDLAYEAWENDRDAWVAEDPENRVPGDYPVAPPDPPDDGGLTYNYGSFAQLSEPAGAPTDELTTLYRKYLQTDEGTIYDGVVGWYQCVDVNYAVWGESVWENSPSSTQDNGESWAWSDPNCVSLGGGFGADLPTTGWTEIEAAGCTVTETTLLWHEGKDQIQSGTEQKAHCPGPWTLGTSEWADIIRTNYAITGELSDGITKSGLISNASGKIPIAWPATPSGASCSSSLSVVWPTIGDCYAGSPPAWPDCSGLPVDASGSATVVKARFRWVIPNTFTGSYFKITWDILEEPEGWNSGLPGAPSRTLTPATPWEWTGPGVEGNENSWKSGWYEIEPPAVPGTRRVVNVKIECYTDPFGSMPDPIGEQVTL